LGDFTFPLKTRRDFEAGEKKFISPPLKSLLVFLLKYAYRPKLCRLSCMHALKLPQIFVFFGQKTTQKLGAGGLFTDIRTGTAIHVCFAIMVKIRAG